MPKRIAIVGYGLEGRSAYRFLLKKFPQAEIIIYDENPEIKDLPADNQTSWQLGNELDWSRIEADLIVRSPGVPLYKFSKHQNLTSVTNLFFQEFKGKIIGVTGSKGKGTTASLIALMLKQAGCSVRLLGNIGEPALDPLGDIDTETIVVYELSSFQLWDLDQTPDVAVVLHLEPDHLNVHTNLDEYLVAKSQIVLAPNHRSLNYLVYNQANGFVKNIVNHAPEIWQKQSYPFLKTAHYDDKNIYYGEQVICSISDINLLGKHNLDNICAALDVAWLFSQDVSAFAQALSDFQGLEHRLQLVGSIGDVKFIDDSIATTIGSVLAAIRAIGGEKVLILGGVNKGADFRQLRQTLVQTKTNHVIAIGQASGEITEQLADISSVTIYNLGLDTSMEEVVDLAYSLTKPAGAVILSPACSSFDMFKSYQDRGQQFQAAVNKLKLSEKPS